MSDCHFERRTVVKAPREEVFAWHERPGAMERLVPPFEEAKILQAAPNLKDGAQAKLRVQLAPGVWKTWLAEHYDYQPGRRFNDLQLEGPFAKWDHSHIFEDDEEGHTVMIDQVTYRLPLSPLSGMVSGGFTRRKLDRMFDYRHAVLRMDFRRHRRANLPKLRILISGSSGLIGSQLVAYFRTAGHDVFRLVRKKPNPAEDEVSWDPHRGFGDDVSALEGFNAVIHLAGAPIADHRWTEDYKRKIRDSRVIGTRHLAEALAKLEKKPEVFLSGSAVGYYGETGDAWVDEKSPVETDFLARTSEEWENAAVPASDAGIRTVLLRTGVVLDPQGGALKKMVPVFRFGLGSPLGDGRMFMPWISIEDQLGAIEHLIAARDVAGPVNLTAPEPARNERFTRTLARVLNRPVGPLPAPPAGLKIAFGEMADEMLLKSQRVRPGVLLDSGFEYVHPDLEECLRFVLGRQ